MPEPIKANEENESEHTDCFSITRYVTKSTEFVIEMDSEFGEGAKFRKIFPALDEAEPYDLITVRIASHGGDCESLVRLVNAFKMCPAKVEMHVIAPCFSAASILSLCGDTLYVYPGAFLMFHNYSSVDFGKGKELADSVARTDRWWWEFCEKNCTPFLTKKELNTISQDKDVTVYPSDKDLQERITRHFKKRN